MRQSSPVLHDLDGERRARQSEELNSVENELAAGDEIADVLASLDADEMAHFEVALCRSYRGERDALEAVRPLFSKHMAARAEVELAKRQRVARDEACEANALSRQLDAAA